MSSITHAELRTLLDQFTQPSVSAHTSEDNDCVDSSRRQLRQRQQARATFYNTLKRVQLVATACDPLEMQELVARAAMLRHKYTQGQGRPRVTVEQYCEAVLAVLAKVDRLPLLKA
jgi:hypothetical protein